MVRSSIADRYLKTLESNSLENAPKSPPKSLKSNSPKKPTSPVRTAQHSSPLRERDSPRRQQPASTKVQDVLGSPRARSAEKPSLKVATSPLPSQRAGPQSRAQSLPKFSAKVAASGHAGQASGVSPHVSSVFNDKSTSAISATSAAGATGAPAATSPARGSGGLPGSAAQKIGPRPDRNPLMHNQDLTPSQVAWDKERKNWSAYEYLCHVVEAKEWLEKILGEEQPPADQFPESLQNGIALARLVRKLRPDLMKWPIFEHKRLQYRHTENITLFFDLLQELHIPQLFQFDMTDLYERRNLPKVIYCLHAISHFIADSEAVSAVDNLVGKLQFSDDQLNTTERGLAGKSMPNFGAMTRQLSGKHPKLNIESDDEETGEVAPEAPVDSSEAARAPSKATTKAKGTRRRLEELDLDDRDELMDDAAEDELDEEVDEAPITRLKIAKSRRGRRRSSSALSENLEDSVYAETDQSDATARDLSYSASYDGEDYSRRDLSDSDDSAIELRPPRRYAGGRKDDYDSTLSALRRVSRDLFSHRRDNYTGRYTRGRGYRNFSSTGSLRSRIMSTAELMLMELEELEPETIRFQAICRGIILRKRVAKARTDETAISFATKLQAICRGKLARSTLNRQQLKLTDSQNESILRLQAALRGALVRRKYCATAVKASQIVHFQGLARGALLRRRNLHKSQLLQSKDSLKGIVALQSAFRGVVLRFRLGCLYDDLDQHTSKVVELQSRIRGSLARRACNGTQLTWTRNVSKIILLQSVWRAKAQGARYRTLIADSNPTLASIKPFLHLIDDKPEDYEREIELESIMKEIGHKVKENEQLEARVDQMDMKIALLVKNKISVDEIMLHQNQNMRQELHRERQLGHDLGIGKYMKRGVSSDTGLKEQFDPNTLQKASRDRIELYQGLFYVLQTQPSYLTRLMMNKPPRSLDMTDLILAVFGSAETNREKFFLLRQLAHTITQSTVGSAANTVAWCMVAQMNRRDVGTHAARKILAPATEKLKACFDQLLEYDPHIIYENLTGGADLSAEEAIQDPAVRTLFVQNLQRLREITMALVQSLARNMSELPFHIKYLAREVYREVLRVSNNREEAMASVGQVVISQFIQPALLAADNLDLVDAAAGNMSKNLVLVSRVIHQIGLMVPFDASGSTDVYLQPLNEFVKSSAHHLSIQFQSTILECGDIATHYNFSELDDITMHERPVLNISMDLILALHYMAFHHVASVTSETDDMLKPIIEQLGPLPKDAREMLDLARFKEIQLELNPRYGTATLNDSAHGSSSLMVTTKRCLVYVLRVQGNQPDLMSVLIAPVELEDEHQYNILLDTENTRECASELANLTFRELKLLTLEKVLELESSGGVSRHDGYQTLINAIADDIRNKDSLRHKRVVNIEAKRRTLKGLEEKCQFLKQRLETYNAHIERALTTLQTGAYQANQARGKRGLQRFQLSSNKPSTTGPLNRQGPRFGQYKTTADKLYERGILIRLRGYEDRHRKDVQLTFSCDKVATFQLDILYKNILLPNGSVIITLDDLLSHQYQNHPHINLMNDELQLSTNRVLQLIFHKFFGTS